MRQTMNAKVNSRGENFSTGHSHFVITNKKDQFSANDNINGKNVILCDRIGRQFDCITDVVWATFMCLNSVHTTSKHVHRYPYPCTQVGEYDVSFHLNTPSNIQRTNRREKSVGIDFQLIQFVDFRTHILFFSLYIPIHRFIHPSSYEYTYTYVYFCSIPYRIIRVYLDGFCDFDFFYLRLFFTCDIQTYLYIVPPNILTYIRFAIYVSAKYGIGEEGI